MEEEKQAFEKAQEEERMRIQKLHHMAATKIQAGLRGTLVRRWSKTELRRKKDEERRLEEEKREWEKVKNEREQERNRIEEEERVQREEMERRRADYERSKEQERHRLEKEQKLEQRKRKEEEDEKRKQMPKKEKRNNITSVKDDCRRQCEDVDNKNKEKEKTKEKSSQGKDECKREEERGGHENKENEVNVRKIEVNNERVRHEKKMENTLDDDKNMMKKQDEIKSIKTEYTERLDDTRPQTKSEKGRIKNHEEEKTVESSAEFDSQVNLSQSRKSLNVTKTTSESHINVHEGLSGDLDLSPVDSSGVADHLSVKGNTDLTVQASDLAVVAPEMDTRGHQNATAFELEDHKPKGQESISICLPDSTEQKRLAWMMSCTPWSKLSLQNKRKVQQQSQKRGPRKRRVHRLPPLSVDTILKTGAWSSLKQVEIKLESPFLVCDMFMLALL